MWSAPAGSVPQLRMGFSRFDQLAPPAPPPGYGLRTYRPGDEPAWRAMLACGIFGDWPPERLAQLLAAERAALPRDGIFMATYDDCPVACACTFFHPTSNGPLPELGWVIVHPLHRGHGLAAVVCRAVLQYAQQRGHRYAYLLTEDYRRAAIRTYLRLGWEPEMTDPAHPAFWERVRRELDA